jgi:carbamoyl-phosphate synthase large subunit
MPLNPNIHKVLMIGSGPIVIGQAAEFDYAGTQACRALREDGIEIVLLNSNPATIMTDTAMADKVYIEPLTLETVKRIIIKEKPDSILSGLGGQTGLTLCMKLAREGFLEKHNVRLLGASPETIDKAEDRELFKETMAGISQLCVPSKVVFNVQDALDFAEEIGYPVIVRPAFTLGGTGGGIAKTPEELSAIAAGGIAMSPIGQILVEKSIAGWKEIEFEVMRDCRGNVITVCSMENMDPVGIHTGDSIVVAPCQTLSDKEYQMLRSAALKIIDALGVEGGCNCQFALHPKSFEYAVIEVNPRVSRSSALASKATGYPIAKVATKLALGYTLDEIKNAVTGNTYAAFEPALDYVAVKMPKWPFDKFVYAKRELGTQMKATGEVMALADSFEAALMKAVRGAEVGADSLLIPRFAALDEKELIRMTVEATDERLFAVSELLRRGMGVDRLHDLSMIDEWFLEGIKNLVQFETSVKGKPLSDTEYVRGKKLGFTDTALRRISGAELPGKLPPVYRMVDTCAGEFEAATPYFYTAWSTSEEGGACEAAEFIKKDDVRETVLVLGSGPIRIGQGIEFDYSSVHCVWALKALGYNVVIVNNNPETVSTDFDTADRLYFEPPCLDDVLDIIALEKPVGVMVAFGGQTAIRLTKALHQRGVRILGTSADAIDMAEDRARFDALLESLHIRRPPGHTVMTEEEALKAARTLGYPVLMRPSYVLGGQNMIIAHDDNDIREYMAIIFSHKQENPVLIDKYIVGKELEVDAICDGEDILIPGIMEHIERTGVHSGDSISVYPATDIDDELREMIVETTAALCRGLGAVGLVNIQYILKDRQLWVIEVNPRASRTVPYISKVTGVPMCELAVKVSLEAKLRDLGYGVGVSSEPPYYAVKVPVFSFEKLTDVDTHLGPEMKSTGEVLGIGSTLEEALFKGLCAAGYAMHREGAMLATVRDSDKSEVADVVKKYAAMGFDIYATEGTAKVLRDSGIDVRVTYNIQDLLSTGKIRYILSTSAKGRDPSRDSVRIRRRAVQLGIPCFTSLDTADAMARCLMSRYSEMNTGLVDVAHMRRSRIRLHFTKLEVCGNDYLCFDCREQEIDSPESLSVLLTDRHTGVGGDGIVLITASNRADARVRIINYDGSEGETGGVPLCCAAKYLYDSGIVPKTRMTLETKSGLYHLELTTKASRVFRARLEMPRPELHLKLIPVNLPGQKIVDHPVKIAGGMYNITCLSMGNPHCVVFCDNVDKLDLRSLGPKFEHDRLFPQRVNTEFVQICGENHLRVRVWERGNGETLCCGTGACAAASAAVLCGYFKNGETIRVTMPGGELLISCLSERVLLNAPVRKVFEGTAEL